MYPWKRFWCPREGKIDLSDGGFLVDPEGEYAKYAASDAVSFDKIAHLPCLALLGEPGIGKTTAMEGLRDEVAATVAASGDSLLYVNLNEYGDESRLLADVFGTDVFARWTEGAGILHLFLDSLDECRIRIPQLAAILTSRFRRVEGVLTRLRLRIACRTADWPAGLEEWLPTLWGKDAFGAYELTPLRRQDVTAAAEAEQVDVTRFFQELARTESVPFAIKPLTLKFLLAVFRERGELPPTRRELYELGCIQLCAELNANRRDLEAHGGAGRLSASQRMAVASRIAAVSIFCRRPIVVLPGETTALTSNDEIPTAQLMGGEEPVGAGDVDVSEASVRETLGTGLFSGRGPYRMGFAHQTYAEFLASRYLISHAVSAGEILKLLRHSDDTTGHIVPQLYETAAWTASANKEVLRTIAPVDPQVLLRGDQGNLTADDRRLIVEALLKALQEGRANTRDWDLWRLYRKLSHPGLADQLRPWIADKKTDSNARYVAIDIAEACEVRALQATLVSVALDQSDWDSIRANAIHALARVGDEDSRRCLRPLALGQAGPDPQDELKGNALKALWPGLVSADELFRNLTLPKDRHFGGAYSAFLNYDLSHALSAADLPYALRWLRTFVHQLRLEYSLHGLADAIVIAAWENMADALALPALAELCADLAKNYDELIQDTDERQKHQQLFDDPARRRMLAKAMVERQPNEDTSAWLLHTWPHMLRQVDMDWCIEQLLSSSGSPTEALWAKWTWWLFGWDSSEWIDRAIDLREKSPAFKKQSDPCFTAVELGSESARKSREEHQHIQELQGRGRRQPQKLTPSPKERVLHWLNRFESGDLDAWRMVVQEMTLEETSTHYTKLFTFDVTTLPGWAEADGQTRARVINGAMTYLVGREPLDTAQLHSGGMNAKDAAALKALVLLGNIRPDLLESLPAEAWRHWLPVLLYPVSSEKKGGLEGLLRRAYEREPDALASVLHDTVMAQAQEKDYVLVLGPIEALWDNRLANVLFGLLPQLESKPKCWVQVLDMLVGHGFAPAFELCRSLLTLPVPKEEPRHQRTIIAGRLLIQHSKDAEWSVVGPMVASDAGFGRELMMAVAHEGLGMHQAAANLAPKMTERQLADLYLFLVGEFPPSTDPNHEDVYSPTDNDSVREFRDGILRYLENKGTTEAVLAIERIAEALPDWSWLRSAVVEAKKNSLRLSWRSCAPADFLALTSRPDSCLVRNADELQDVLIDALGALEGQLQGETPAAPDLWDQVGRTPGHESFRPKDENHLSDWVKRHLEAELRTRGIVAAREVQIRRGEGIGQGETTDIHVTAIVPGLSDGTYEQVRVIIETKGCWHQELKSAMRTQLVERYLKDNQSKHGIYLVGWYQCAQWDEQDNRKRPTINWPLYEARLFFKQQAVDLSKGGLRIRAAVINAALR